LNQDPLRNNPYNEVNIKSWQPSQQ